MRADTLTVNSASIHAASISSSPSSIRSSRRALSATSSTTDADLCSCNSITSRSTISGFSWGGTNARPVASISCCQWRGRMPGWPSACSKGHVFRKSFTVSKHAARAPDSRAACGMPVDKRVRGHVHTRTHTHTHHLHTPLSFLANAFAPSSMASGSSSAHLMSSQSRRKPRTCAITSHMATPVSRMAVAARKITLIGSTISLNSSMSARCTCASSAACWRACSSPTCARLCCASSSSMSIQNAASATVCRCASTSASNPLSDSRARSPSRRTNGSRLVDSTGSCSRISFHLSRHAASSSAKSAAASVPDSARYSTAARTVRSRSRTSSSRVTTARKCSLTRTRPSTSPSTTRAAIPSAVLSTNSASSSTSACTCSMNRTPRMLAWLRGIPASTATVHGDPDTGPASAPKLPPKSTDTVYVAATGGV